MTSPIVILVVGTPRPGGSKTPYPLKRGGKYVTAPNGRPIVKVVDDAKGNAAWKHTVKLAGLVAMGAREPLDGPLTVTVTIRMPRPKCHLRKDGTLKPSAPCEHTIKPDATKLWRSTEDALTGVVWRDDGQIIHQEVKKGWAEPGIEPGASITVTRAGGDRGEQ